MDIIYKLQNWELRLKEKFHPPYISQVMRGIKMFTLSPYKTTRRGMLKVMFGVTYRCQCKCEYCCSGKYPVLENKELTKRQILEILRQIASLPSLSTVVDFFGGEPLLREDIYEVIEFATNLGLFTELETNGILLNKKNIIKLKKAGIHHIFVRIESQDPKTHDRLSNYKGCYQKALGGIKNCVEKGISCTISTIALKEKIRNKELEKIIELGKTLHVNSIRILYPILTGNWSGKFEQLLTEEEKAYIKTLLRPDFVYLESTYIAKRTRGKFCPALKKQFFYISPYGEIQPCPFFPLFFGNVTTQSLEKLLKDMWRNKIFNGKFKGDCPINENARTDFSNQVSMMKFSR